MIDLLLVPQGVEYEAVCRGVRGMANPPPVWPVAAGPAIGRSLAQLHQTGVLQSGQSVVLLGLCGALVPELAVGARVLYRDCRAIAGGQVTGRWLCDRDLTTAMQQQLGLALVEAVTCDRVVSTVAAKHDLAQQFAAQVVDMEGSVALASLTALGIRVAMVRVVSDGSDRDIPDLTNVFTADGELQPLALTMALLRQPVPAFHLIRGSLSSLKILQALTTDLFKNRYT